MFPGRAPAVTPSATIDPWPPSTASTARRPSRRWSVRKRSCDTLTNAIEQDKVRQAYLFAGPRGTGKTSLARILAKSVNCEHGPTATPDNTCHACVAISNGSSLDVIEMDAASQRGIDDIREIRDRVVLQPVEGRSKVYILDEAHQLTDAAWNALLKLIEEPPPHLLFVFCTTELQKVLPTVRSRCQTFVFQRPRLPELMRKLRLIADGEGIDVPDAALALVARGGRGAYPRRRVDARPARRLDRRRRSRCRTSSSSSAPSRTRCSSDSATWSSANETADALVFLEELSERGQDLGRLVTDLLEHLRHLLLVQHMHEVPDSLPVTDEARERLREQANQLAARDGGPPDRPARRRGRRHAPGRRPAAAARARARQGDAARRRPLARVAGVPHRAARARSGPHAARSRTAFTPGSRVASEPRPPREPPARDRSRRRSSSSSSRRPGGARSCRPSSSARSRSARRSARRTRPRSTATR